MKRTVIALAALTSVVSGVALADTANVNVYGTLNVSYGSYKTSGTLIGEDVSARMRLNCNSCNFGLKGTEDISEGVKGIWQFESSVGGAGGFGGGTLAIRNSGLGMTGDWGTLMFGQWDTPFKLLVGALEPTYSTGAGYMVSMLDTPGLNATSTTFSAIGLNETATVKDVSFSRRQNSSIWYNSPKFAGIDATVMYSGNGGKSATNANPGMISTALRYSEGMIMAGFAYESHMDARSASTFTTTHGLSSALSTPTAGTSDTGVKLMAAVKPIEGLTIGGAWSSLSYKNKVAAGDDKYSKSAFMASALYGMDKWGFGFSFASAADGSCTLASGTACTVTDNGATHMTGKVSYSYSKRTDVYVAYSKIDNKANGTYNFALGAADQPATIAGAGANGDPSFLGIGIRHTF